MARMFRLKWMRTEAEKAIPGYGLKEEIDCFVEFAGAIIDDLDACLRLQSRTSCLFLRRTELATSIPPTFEPQYSPSSNQDPLYLYSTMSNQHRHQPTINEHLNHSAPDNNTLLQPQHNSGTATRHGRSNLSAFPGSSKRATVGDMRTGHPVHPRKV